MSLYIEERRIAKERFASYVSDYDMKDPKISLKAVHTYKVAELCENIGISIGMEGEELFVAWMCGLLHDIGRFEQVTRYNTFVDAESMDHALLSTEILFGKSGEEDGILRDFLEMEEYDDILYKAILYHSAYRLPKELTEQEKMYCDILRDADKIDIFRVNLETPMEEIYNTTAEELYNSEVTPEVLQAFMEHHAVLRSLKKTPVDNVVGHISLFYELVYPKSRELALEQGYLKKLSQFESNCPETQANFEKIRCELDINNRYIIQLGI